MKKILRLALLLRRAGVGSSRVVRTATSEYTKATLHLSTPIPAIHDISQVNVNKKVKAL